MIRLILQLILYCVLFTLMVKYAVRGGAIDGLYFYPNAVQDRAIEIGLTDRDTMNRKRNLKKRSILALIWVGGAAIVALIVVVIGSR